ncbi:MAG: hypothetical protein R3D55_05605 [Chloroflexota bacterium]
MAHVGWVKFRFRFGGGFGGFFETVVSAQLLDGAVEGCGWRLPASSCRKPRMASVKITIMTMEIIRRTSAVIFARFKGLGGKRLDETLYLPKIKKQYRKCAE